jgi:hypothetical protein
MAGEVTVIAAPEIEVSIAEVARDLELHLCELGLHFIAHGQEIPEWLWDDLEAALKLQGAI